MREPPDRTPPTEREWEYLDAIRVLEARTPLPVVGVLKEVRFYHDGGRVCMACESRNVPR